VAEQQGDPHLQARAEALGLGDPRLRAAATLRYEPVLAALGAEARSSVPALQVSSALVDQHQLLATGGFLALETLGASHRLPQPWLTAWFTPELGARTVLAAARASLEWWRERFPEDPWGPGLLAASERWFLDPSSERRAEQSAWDARDPALDQDGHPWAWRLECFRERLAHDALKCARRLSSSEETWHPEPLRKLAGEALTNAALAAGEEALLDALRQEVAPWLAGISDPLRVREARAGKLPAGEEGVCERLQRGGVGFDRVLIAARCGDAVARSLLTKPQPAAQLFAPGPLLLPARLAGSPEEPLRGWPRHHPLLLSWTADCLAHVTAGLPRLSRGALAEAYLHLRSEAFLQPRDELTWAQVEALSRVQEGLRHIRDKVDPRWPLASVARAFEWVTRGRPADARWLATQARAALVRDARGVARPTETSSDSGIEAEAEAAVAYELDWQLERYLELAAAHHAGLPPEPWRAGHGTVLRVLSRPRAGVSIPLDPRRVSTIGRGEDADVLLPGVGGISRLHARVELRDDSGWWLTNASPNGVEIGDRVVRGDLLLAFGSPFNVGRVALVLDHPGADPTPQAPAPTQEPATHTPPPAEAVQTVEPAAPAGSPSPAPLSGAGPVRGAGTIAVRVQARQRCPYCREGLGMRAALLLTCAGCRVVYHRECIFEFGSCATAGCRNNSRRAPPAQPR
jgi:FHA domain